MASFDGLSNAVREAHRRDRIRVRQSDHDLVPSKARGYVAGPDQAPDHATDLCDRARADEVTVAVDHRLEVVEVEDDERDRAAAGEQPHEAPVEVTRVAETRQVIGDRSQVRLTVEGSGL